MKMWRGFKTLQSDGFTIIELIIALAVLTLLLLMGITNLQSAERPARDEERKTDAGNIALAFERYYKAGNPERNLEAGRYPSTAEVNAAITGGYITESFLPETTKPMFYYSFKKDNFILKIATNSSVDSPAGSAFTQLNSTGNAVNHVLYEPMMLTSSNTWTLCTQATQDCRRFNIYYLLESQPVSSTNVQTIRSLNQ